MDTPKSLLAKKPAKPDYSLEQLGKWTPWRRMGELQQAKNLGPR